MDQQLQAKIHETLKSGDKCVTYIQAGLVQDWVKLTRVLSVIEHNKEHGFLVYKTKQNPEGTDEVLIVEDAFPINDDFKCKIDSPHANSKAGADVYLKVAIDKKKFLFELPFSARSNTFVAEVSKASETYALRMGPPSSFSWLRQYRLQREPLLPDLVEQTVPKSTDLGFEDNFNDVYAENNVISESREAIDIDRKADLDSPDGFGNIPRHSIAMGATPLAARESVVRLQMAMREEDYITIQNFRIFTGTWNVNGKAPTVSLTEWLSSDPDPPDIYAVGFQELDLSTEAYIFHDTPRENEWLCAVINGLHSKAKYRKVKLVRLIGMMLVVFIQEKYVRYVHDIACDTVGTGIMGKMGNKGGVAVRFDLHNTSMCFVNCHLAAHVEEYERRNQDYNDICSRMIFNQFKPPKAIKDHDQIYWIGDMNYRISDLDLERVKALIEKQCYPMLLEHDQLRIQHNLKRVFVGLTEGVIDFVPTYKYDPGTNNWDSSEKSRPPAWCDRILWKGDHIKQLYYRCHKSILISDHKPVSALFESGMKVVQEQKYRKIYEEVMKKLDKLENEFLPQVALDKMEVHFDEIKFIERQTRFLTIANIGQVPVQFQFIKKLNDTRFCKEWLRIKPYVSFIMPGEKCDIEMEVYVDKTTAWKLNSGKDRIYDILVLHLDGGKDLFITVSGMYIPSCFGSSLEALVQMQGPIRDVPVANLINLETTAKPEDKVAYEIPKEIWILVDHIFKYGLNQEDLFQQPGLGAEVQRIRDRLDTGWPEHVPGSIHSVAEAFLIFLEALAEPVVPYSFYEKCLECSSNFTQCKQVVAKFPEVHKKVFQYLIVFQREIRLHSSSNKLDPKVLANCFGSILLRPPPTLRETQSAALLADRKKATFIYHFLMNDYEEL